jgi:spore coat protein H
MSIGFEKCAWIVAIVACFGCGSEDGNTDKACESGASRCSDETLQRCEDGAWRDWDDCDVLGGACVTKEGEASCSFSSKQTDTDSDPSSDGDTDADTDADTDTDTDADSDGDTDADTDTDANTDEGPHPETVFNQNELLEYHITMAEADRLQIEEFGDEEVYVPAALQIVGGEIDETFEEVGFRHKGAWSLHHCYEEGYRDYEDECAKISYKVKFNEFADDARFFGYKRINLHAMSNEHTKVRERLAYGLYNAFGVIAPQTAYAELYINEELMGLFLQVEQIDGRFTAFHFPHDKDGNLYKEVWPKPGLSDDHFLSALRTNDNPEDNPDVSDMQEFGEAIDGCTEETFADVMSDWMDLDNILRYMTVDRAIKNWDGVVSFYSTYTSHNFYWYHEAESGGIFHLVPWDMDNALPDFDPYMHPQEWLETLPIPDWNVSPLSCNPVPVWNPESTTGVVPPGCDKFFNLLAATSWDAFTSLGEALLEGPLDKESMADKVTAWAAEIDDAAAADPFIDHEAWQEEIDHFLETTLDRSILDFTHHLTEGYRIQEQGPAPQALDDPIPESGLLIGQVNNYEFSDSPGNVASIGVTSVSDENTVAGATWNTADPVSGTADLRYDFEFNRTPGEWNEWTNITVGTDGDEAVDISSLYELVLTMRADSPRSVHVRIQSPVFGELFGGAWSGFGGYVTVTEEPTEFSLVLEHMRYADWARDAWEEESGWRTSDYVALRDVLQNCSGIILAPSATTDDAGELISAVETGFLQLDNIYFR